MLKMIIMLFFSVLLLLPFNSCVVPGHPKCRGDNENRGIIKEALENLDEIIANHDEKTVVIKSKEEYFTFFTHPITEEPYSNELPEIDFDNYTLLGVCMYGKPPLSFVREVQKKPDDKVYYYTIKMYVCGSISTYSFSMNWVLVPKLPEGWDVFFEKIIIG